MIEVYTDGSCSFNGHKNVPTPGGYGVVMIEDNKIIFSTSGFRSKTTNNEMELTALVAALTQLEVMDVDLDNVVIYSDSAYVVNIWNDWMHKWSKNGWTNAKGDKIANYDLVLDLYEYYIKKFSNCQVEKIQGHFGHAGNELADALATGNSDKYLKIVEKNGLAVDVKLRKKKT